MVQAPHKGWTPLMLVVNASDEKAAPDVLLQAKANPNMRCDDDSLTVLHYAIRAQRLSVDSRRRGDRAAAPALRGRRQRALRRARHASALPRHHLRLQAPAS